MKEMEALGRPSRVQPVEQGADPRKKSYKDSDVMNTLMIAERFGVQHNTVQMWRKRRAETHFPPPDISMPGERRPYSIWYWRTIRKWAMQHRPKML